MNPDHASDAHERFADWDAAYVLGALTTTDRREYEAHLSACAQCRAAVAELAPTVGLLSRLPANEADRADEGPDESARAGLFSLARKRVRRRRRTTWLVTAAAAVLIVAIAIAVPFTIGVATRPSAWSAMEDVADVPITASVRLTDVAWGTRIELECAYPDVYIPDAPEGGWTYALAVVGEDGSASTVSTWRAGPGSSARLGAGSALDLSDIAAIEIRTAKGVVLMRYDVAPSAG